MFATNVQQLVFFSQKKPVGFFLSAAERLTSGSFTRKSRNMVSGQPVQ
jgi:hypothetical protein